MNFFCNLGLQQFADAWLFHAEIKIADYHKALGGRVWGTGLGSGEGFGVLWAMQLTYCGKPSMSMDA